ncbi:hypothetical protein INT47_001294 [Mucor saturninus]|uniref:FAR1 domain-containing protein n=1 Tax=Mucor saturninus TaxID=64648 RepID=A0A8H7RP15_9FUNG|nr:hypothetical protein INT47_001294 [Mucor saturninus]
MNSKDSQQSLSESQLLINSLLSVINPVEEIKDSFEDAFDRQVYEQSNTDEKVTVEEYDWECLSEPEMEDISVKATRHVPSFAETVSVNERVANAKAIFEAEFPVGKAFADKEIARLEIQYFSKANNIPFETFKCDKSYIKMVCKHFGKYRTAKKGEDEKDAVNDDELENSVQRPNRTTGRTGCSAFVYIRKNVKLAGGEPWTVRSSCFEHNHPLSQDKRAYHSNHVLPNKIDSL